jgi:hypothetical protein
MARREPITDVHLRELALKRFRKASPEPAASLGESLKKLMDEIPADRSDAVTNATYVEIESYRTSKLISRHEGPDSVAESLRLRIDILKKARQAILELPAVPHTGPRNLQWYYTAHAALQTIIDAEETEMVRLNKQVSPGKAKQQSTLLRNDLAVGVKGIAIGLLAKDEREAEKWVEQVFDALRRDHPNPDDPLHLTYPDADGHPSDFRDMFAVTVGRLPQKED